jgi:hypothetical protein
VDCFPARVRRKIAQYGYDNLAASIELLHTKLLKYRQPVIYANDCSTEQAITVGHIFVLWQSHLHRAERLMVSCGSTIENNDPYGLAALIRAFLESTAIITSIRAKMDDWAEQRITYEEFDKALMATLLGSRSEHVPNSPPAINILTHIKNADRHIDRRAPMAELSPLSTMYGALSEYAHPNLPSNAVAFALEEPGVYRFQHNAKITDKHVMFLGMLGTCALVFERISASYHAILTEGSDAMAAELAAYQLQQRERLQ